MTTGHPRYVFRAEDSKGRDGSALSLKDQVEIAALKPQQTGHLEYEIELAIRMKAMVVLNITTEVDLANGMRGEIVDIILDTRDKKAETDERQKEVKLNYPPALIIFRPFHMTVPSFQSLKPGHVPIFPTERTFHIPGARGREAQVTQRQIVVMATYAFTDYKAQGQTIENMIVDLAKPPFDSCETLMTAC